LVLAGEAHGDKGLVAACESGRQREREGEVSNATPRATPPHKVTDTSLTRTLRFVRVEREQAHLPRHATSRAFAVAIASRGLGCNETLPDEGVAPLRPRAWAAHGNYSGGAPSSRGPSAGAPDWRQNNSWHAEPVPHRRLRGSALARRGSASGQPPVLGDHKTKDILRRHCS
jgi:hypothetical protein